MRRNVLQQLGRGAIRCPGPMAAPKLRRTYAIASTAADTPFSMGLTADQSAYRDLARKFAAEEVIPVAAHHDQTMEYPMAVIKKAHEIGLLNTHIPEAYGGLGLSLLETALISEEIAYGCTGISTAMEANGLAQAPVIVAGNEEQK